MRESHLRLLPSENGPKGMSNGGFAAGSFAQLVGGTAEVKLQAKVPLNVELNAVSDGNYVEISYGGHRIATAERKPPFVLEPPVVPSMEEAFEARRRHPLRGVRHPLSNCVVCGPERHDGLRVTAGPLGSDREVSASPFIPAAQYAKNGDVRPEAVWGALDCPSYPAAAMRSRRFCLLGSIEAHQTRPVSVGERLVVVGWTIKTGTRSTRTASAIVDEGGSVVASARAIWVELRHQRLIRALGQFS